MLAKSLIKDPLGMRWYGAAVLYAVTMYGLGFAGLFASDWAINAAEDLDSTMAGILDGAWRNYGDDWLPRSRGADDEMIFGALMHDVGKAISVPNHGAISAEMIKPYVRDDVYRAILNHQDFQGMHYYGHFGAPTDLRYTKYDQNESWWALCAEFTDDWDQQAFDPDAETYSLEHFEPLIRRITAEVKTGLGSS